MDWQQGARGIPQPDPILEPERYQAWLQVTQHMQSGDKSTASYSGLLNAPSYVPPPPPQAYGAPPQRRATANDIDAARAAYEAARPLAPPQHYGAPPPPQTYAPAPPADTPLAIRLRHAAAQWDVTRAERQPPARARDRSPSPASPDIGTRPKRRHIVAAPEAEPTPEPPAPVEDDAPRTMKVAAAPIKFSLGGAFDKNDGAAFSNDGSFLKAVKRKLAVAPVEEAAAPPAAKPLGTETPAEDEDDDDDCYEVSLGMRPGAAAAADDDSGDDEGYTVRLGMGASTAVPDASPAWATSARALLEASRERKLGDLRAVLTTHGFGCGPTVGGGYFIIEAPKTYPCVMDVIGREYVNAKSSTTSCSFRMRSQKQLVKYLEGALERGAGVRLESAWDWAAHTDSVSRSRSQSPPPRSAEAAADASPPRTPPPKRARTEPATIYAWCEARGWATDSTRYRDIIMCCDDIDTLAEFWDHPERAEVLEDWPTLARSCLKRGIKALQAVRAQ
jgi:hypothetical protein